jgi:hypothetical protein
VVSSRWRPRARSLTKSADARLPPDTLLIRTMLSANVRCFAASASRALLKIGCAAMGVRASNSRQRAEKIAARDPPPLAATRTTGPSLAGIAWMRARSSSRQSGAFSRSVLALAASRCVAVRYRSDSAAWIGSGLPWRKTMIASAVIAMGRSGQFQAQCIRSSSSATSSTRTDAWQKAQIEYSR